MIVMKFGGSSVADAERIRRVASIIEGCRAGKPLVVLSAMGDTTDALLEAGEAALSGIVDTRKVEEPHRAAIRGLGLEEAPGVEALLAELKTLLAGVSMVGELSRRSRDYLVSFGERLCVRIAAAYFTAAGLPARAVDAWDAGFVSDSRFTCADLLEETWSAIPAALAWYTSGASGEIPVVTGFIARDKAGRVTTLGRGGSDLTATMLGAALGAAEIQTWKDVDGILTADPRVVPDARTAPEATYDEAAEMAFFGSQVLHPRSMEPCRRAGSVVRVKNSYNPSAAGSVILRAHTAPAAPVRTITQVKPVILIDIISSRMLGAAGFLAHIFNQFLKWNVSIDVIATSEVSVSLTVHEAACDEERLAGLLRDIGNAAETECRRGKAIIALICDVSRSSAILAAAFSALSEAGVNVQMISQGASKVNISMLCEAAEADRVVRILHRAFFG